MAEYIKREDALSAVLFLMERQRIREIPAADVVEVVRCRECKYWRGIDEFGDGYCGNSDGIDNVAKPDDFCSHGTREED